MITTDHRTVEAPPAGSGMRRIRNLVDVVSLRAPHLRGDARAITDEDLRARLVDEEANLDREALAEINDWLLANGVRAAGWLRASSVTIVGDTIHATQVVSSSPPDATWPAPEVGVDGEEQTVEVAVPLHTEPPAGWVAEPGEIASYDQ